MRRWSLWDERKIFLRGSAPVAGEQPLDYAHRHMAEGDIYFVRNPNGYAVKERATFA